MLAFSSLIMPPTEPKRSKRMFLQVEQQPLPRQVALPALVSQAPEPQPQLFRHFRRQTLHTVDSPLEIEIEVRNGSAFGGKLRCIGNRLGAPPERGSEFPSRSQDCNRGIPSTAEHQPGRMVDTKDSSEWYCTNLQQVGFPNDYSPYQFSGDSHFMINWKGLDLKWRVTYQDT